MFIEGGESGLLANRITTINRGSVGDVYQQRELWRVLLGVAAEESGSSIEP